MKKIYIKYKDGHHFAIVDDKDYEFINQYRWYLSSDKRYAVRSIWDKKIKRSKAILMHRQILEINNNGEILGNIDHIDNNGLNNQRNNIRICSQSQNCANKKKYKNNISKYKGVGFDTRVNKWTSRIIMHKKTIGLGYWDSEVDAAIAYDIKAIELYKEFSNLNFPYIDKYDYIRINDKLKYRFKFPTRRSGICSSEYINVTLSKHGTWECSIEINEKEMYIGRFKNEIDAAMIRDLFKIKLSRDDNYLNFPLNILDENKERLLSLLKESKREILLK